MTKLRYLFVFTGLGTLGCCNSLAENDTQVGDVTPGVSHTIDTVEIIQMKFNPEILLVDRGDSVVFINRDLVDHDVTDEINHAWTSTTLTPGQSWVKVVTQNEDYFCSLHLIMKGKIQLQPGP